VKSARKKLRKNDRRKRRIKRKRKTKPSDPETPATTPTKQGAGFKTQPTKGAKAVAKASPEAPIPIAKTTPAVANDDSAGGSKEERVMANRTGAVAPLDEPTPTPATHTIDSTTSLNQTRRSKRISMATANAGTIQLDAAGASDEHESGASGPSTPVPGLISSTTTDDDEEESEEDGDDGYATVEELSHETKLDTTATTSTTAGKESATDVGPDRTGAVAPGRTDHTTSLPTTATSTQPFKHTRPTDGKAAVAAQPPTKNNIPAKDATERVHNARTDDITTTTDTETAQIDHPPTPQHHTDGDPVTSSDEEVDVHPHPQGR
jgi:hypothetical protein